jgi:major membrane immunogen (membrane-anchored lipoprotein)
MMKRIAVLVIMSLVLLGGCGRENSCNVVLNQNHGTITPEELSAAAVGSSSESSEDCAIVPSIGGQLLKLAYVKYSQKGRTESELDRLPKSLFSINLAKLYRDVKVAVE